MLVSWEEQMLASAVVPSVAISIVVLSCEDTTISPPVFSSFLAALFFAPPTLFLLGAVVFFSPVFFSPAFAPMLFLFFGSSSPGGSHSAGAFSLRSPTHASQSHATQ